MDVYLILEISDKNLMQELGLTGAALRFITILADTPFGDCVSSRPVGAIGAAFVREVVLTPSASTPEIRKG